MFNLQQLFHEHNLRQLSNKPTHIRKHMLDLVLTRGVGETTDFDIDDKIDLSDHYVIKFISNIEKPPSLKQHVATRNIKALNADSF